MWVLRGGGRVGLEAGAEQEAADGSKDEESEGDEGGY